MCLIPEAKLPKVGKASRQGGPGIPLPPPLQSWATHMRHCAHVLSIQVPGVKLRSWRFQANTLPYMLFFKDLKHLEVFILDVCSYAQSKAQHGELCQLVKQRQSYHSASLKCV